jgi:hypothetical protein
MIKGPKLVERHRASTAPVALAPEHSHTALQPNPFFTHVESLQSHSSLAAFALRPAGQLVHAGLPEPVLRLYVDPCALDGHGVQAKSPAALNVPLGQATHVRLPVWDEVPIAGMRPAAHVMASRL